MSKHSADHGLEAGSSTDARSAAAAVHGKDMAQVAVIMGSDSDLPTMRPAVEILTTFGVPVETSIVSAHRTPMRMVEYAQTAADRGIKVIVAGAGGAAHLPGMVAALTDLPVIGVPVRGSSLDGLDSLLSIVQMPRGVPVATVAINNGLNAGLLAARILALSNPVLGRQLRDYREARREEVEARAAALEAGDAATSPGQ